MSRKRNNLYNAETWEKVNEDSKFLLEDYQAEMQVQGKSDGTIYQYSIDIKGFLCYVHDNLKNKYILDLKRRDFRNFFLRFQKDTSPARVNRMQSSIRNMLEYAYDNEEDFEYDRNIMKSIKGLESQAVNEHYFLTDEEVEYLIKYCIEEDNLQKALFLSLSYDSARRRNEIFQVEKYSFLQEDRRATNSVIGKRGKEFQVYYSNRTRLLALEYLKTRGEDDIDSLWIKQTLDGHKSKISYESLYYWTISLRKPYAEKFGKEIDFTPHDIRRSSLTNLQNGTHYMLEELGVKNFDMSLLSAYASHESSETTEKFYLPEKEKEMLTNLFGE